MAPPGVHFVRADGQAAKPATAPCAFPVFSMAPRGAFEEIGVVEYFPTGSVASGRGRPDLASGAEGLDMARTLATPFVCANGGNALVLGQINAVGVYKRATVIRLLPAR